MLPRQSFLRRRLEHSGAADLNPAYRLISSHQLIADNPEGAKMFSQHHPCIAKRVDANDSKSVIAHPLTI